MSATFDKHGNVLVGDKFGDIVRFNKTDFKSTVVAGCVSMVTDLLATPQYIIMADRDEKIRLINADHPVLIERFLLQHTEYVSGIVLAGEQLVSIGGDGCLMLWALEKEVPLQVFRVGDSFDPVGIAVNKDATTIAYVLDKTSAVHLVSLENGRLVETIQTINLPTGCRPSTIACVGKEWIIGGKLEDAPFLARINDGQVDVIRAFAELDLSKESQDWSQIVRSHLRKLKYPKDDSDADE
ncbi:tRNA (guanine-N(7)-)-methyltransferase non-catalytic subunit [Paramicrosporidium saccamoebae]|uniref:tRNA (Guanine-N(7)-)-methyltransferase non-catalytic subunit n=1 Tax=Paramicrosporidium saccamoebae TaxID=1246581 RepID=A0A2H9TFM2_9FUNG|nr:tRNA (guanine-N(7)-)-methyltransferase non-catalytic subunit [Paramicrosporidium saccamoebae]